MRPHTFVLVLVGLFANDLGSRFRENVKRLPESFQGATITGQVVDARTFQPLRGAIVTAARTPVNKDQPNIGFRTGEDGKFVLRGVAPGIVNFSVFKAGYVSGPFPSVRPAADGEQIDNVTLTVPQGASVSGRVLDESGHPVAGMAVRLTNVPSRVPVSQVGAVAVTAEDGRYLLGGLPAGDHVIAIGSVAEPAEIISSGTATRIFAIRPGDRQAIQSQMVRLSAGEDRGDVDLMIRFPDRITGPRRIDDGTGTIEGRVVDVTGISIPHAAVFLRRDEKSAATIISRSDATGRWVFQKVPAGQFLVGAARVGFSAGVTGDAGPPITLRIAAGARIENVVVTAWRGGAISGTLTDEFGEHASGAVIAVSPTRPAVSFGTSYIGPDGAQVFGRGTGTDARGRYRLTGLQPGEYLVSVVAGDPTTARAEVHFTDSAGQDRILTPLSMFYPGVATVSQASKVTVTEGGESAGVDVTLRPMLMSQIIVTATASRPVGEIRLHQIQLDDALSILERTTSMTGSTLTLDARPGRYRLLASAEVASNADNVVRLWASADVDTDPAIPAAVNMHLEPGANINGRVVFEGTEPNRQGSGARLMPMNPLPVLPTRARSSEGNPMFEPATGIFSIEGILPGRYVIQAGGGRWTLKAAMIGGRDVLDEPIEIRPGDEIEHVRLTVTDRITELSGKVADAATRPANLEWVLVFPVDKKHWWAGSTRIRSIRPDYDGAYAIRGLPPGTYVVTVVPDPAVLMAPAKLSALAASGIRVTLAEGDRKTQDLRKK